MKIALSAAVLLATLCATPALVQATAVPSAAAAAPRPAIDQARKKAAPKKPARPKKPAKPKGKARDK